MSDDVLTRIGKSLLVSSSILDTIYSINHNCYIGTEDSPCLKLPDEAWEEPGLLSKCPKCNEAIRFNPFTVDNRGTWD
jgi:hypothetical protein